MSFSALARRILSIAIIVVGCLSTSNFANAQTTSGGLSGLYPNFFELAIPGRFSLTLFGGGYLSDKSATVQEGFQFEQSITPYIGLVGRAAGYQLWVGNGFDNPLDPGTGSHSRYNFGRFEGGVDFAITPNNHFYLLGGGDVGDSHAGIIEGDFSSWALVHSAHPLNFLVTAVHNWQNGVTSSGIDLRTVLLSTEDFLLMAGGGGAIYGGGFVTGVAGQGGPDFGVYYRPWQMGADAQAGYGSSNQYGQVTLYKQFSWIE